MKVVKRFFDIVLRELLILRGNHIYLFCMFVFPILVIVFFTSMMDDGLPTSMPVGVVDSDNTSTTRALTRRLDAFQMSHVVARYPSVMDARKAIQRNEIYAFLYIPKGTTDNLLSSRQPKISFYYSMTSLASGALLMKDLKTISTLGSAAVGQATLQAKGATDLQIQTLLQPIKVDLHQIANPWTSYNVYLSTVFVPGLIMLFIFLISAYSLGTELKFDTGKEWLEMANGNILVAILGKFLPHTLIFLAIVYGYEWYVFMHLGFPHNGSAWMLALIGLMQVLASQGFGIFAFGLMPSLRMSMSVCSLWAVLSFSMAGNAFPVMGMDGPLQSLSWLFPLRHYYMMYQITVFNGFPLIEAWFHFAALVAFMLLPWFVVKKIKNAMLTYVYIP
ncbi:ABC transporter permease [Prevotella sp. E13-27]|uniref:ABC transporter permease n=1 Tax=Prevotella sp. E13-27 TaxID=2938122 RepID=UPI00200A1CC9|nr:ABC transporter permease [Prevotella sp. E13-27]MCK8622417.1 ABC transporter permease [Prevotella sp. E13-27]